MNSKDINLNPEPEVEILAVETPEVEVEVVDEASDFDVEILSAEPGQPVQIDDEGYVLVDVEDGDYEVLSMVGEDSMDVPDIEFLDFTTDDILVDACLDDGTDAPAPEIDNVFADFLPDAGCDMPLDTDTDLFG